MARFRRYKKKAAPRRRRFGRRAPRRTKRIARRKQIPRNVASVTESFDIDVKLGQGNNYTLFALGDAEFDRAQQVAKAYREFRIKFAQVIFQFPYNVFAPNVSSEPRWWVFTDPRDAIPDNYTKGLLQDMGYKPRRARGMQKVTWAPYVTIGVTENQVAPTAYFPHLIKKHPWLSTNNGANSVDNTQWDPSTVLHSGIKWLMEDTNSPALQLPIKAQVRVCFQFRKPVWYNESGTQVALEIAQNREEETPDLVVEGPAVAHVD